MSGDTHMAVGAGCATLVSTFIFPDVNIISLVEYATIGAVGGLIVDVDVASSKGARIVNKILSLLGVFIAAVIIATVKGSSNSVINLSKLDYEFVCKFIAFISMIVVGKSTGHRTITHSVEWILGVSAIVCLADYKLGLAFCIGALTHSLVDLLNAKDVTLSIIFKIKMCFRIIEADNKKANQILQGIGSTFCILSLFRVLK